MNIAVITAGGVGTRMNSREKPKQFLIIQGRPIIVHTLKHFDKSSEIDAIIVVCLKEWISHMEELLDEYRIRKVVKIVPGGETGQMSIYNGLVAAKEISTSNEDIVLVHDGVRPLINEKTISDNIQSVKNHGSAVTMAAVKETIIEVEADNKVKQVTNRSISRFARAPQSFYLEELLEAHIKAQQEKKTEFVDSCTLMKYYGKELYAVEGPDENIKVTTPGDFYIMRSIYTAQEDYQIYGIL